MDMKDVIEGARFSIETNTLYEGFMCVGMDFKPIDNRTNSPLLFTAKDLLIDAVTLEIRPTPQINVWRRRLNMEIIEYAYKMVPYRRATFVWDLRENEKTKMDYLVVVFEDRYVKRSGDYDDVYNIAIDRVAK